MNTESLKRFKQFEELRRNAQRVVKQRKINSHLSIRFSSVTEKNEVGAKEAHNYVSFGDSKQFHRAFRESKKKPPAVTRGICPLTGLTAKYYDPVTKLPYANLQAFKLLRQIHADATSKHTSQSTTTSVKAV